MRYLHWAFGLAFVVFVVFLLELAHDTNLNSFLEWGSYKSFTLRDSLDLWWLYVNSFWLSVVPIEIRKSANCLSNIVWMLDTIKLVQDNALIRVSSRCNGICLFTYKQRWKEMELVTILCKSEWSISAKNTKQIIQNVWSMSWWNT